MAVFIIIMIVAAQAFNTIVIQSSKFSKMEETNIEGVVGLEVMRHDLEQMGFGLPWSFKGGVTYYESTVADPVTNDAPGNIPRAFVGLDGFSNFSSDFVAVKASSVGNTKASQRWTYIPYHNFSTSSGRESRPISFSTNNLRPSTDKVIALRTSFNNMSTSVPVSRQPVQQLAVDSSGSFYFNYNNTGGIDDPFLPGSDQDTHYIYGIETVAPRMPFNRADFFIEVPAGGSLPPFCAPRTGVLYKASVINTGVDNNGGYTKIPLLDCVADMQVVLGWSSNAGIGRLQDSVNGYSSLPKRSDGSVSVIDGISVDDVKGWLQDAQMVREHLKMIKVYILAQEGKRDANYTFPVASIKMYDENNHETTLSRAYTFSDEQRHYRWKLYRIFVKPKNLASNQR